MHERSDRNRDKQGQGYEKVAYNVSYGSAGVRVGVAPEKYCRKNITIVDECKIRTVNYNEGTNPADIARNALMNKDTEE